MIEFAAYLAAQQLTNDAVREALPDAPVRAAGPRPRWSFRSLAWRQRISMTLRHLADLVEPMPEPGKPAVAGCQ